MTTEREALEAIRNYAIALQKGALPDDAEEARILAMIEAALSAPAIPQYHTTQSLAVEQDRAAREAPVSQREAYQRGYAEGARSSVPAGWIACSERMPESGDAVLAWEIDEGCVFAAKAPGLPDWYVWYWEGEIKPEITHWMPLPPPPAQDTTGEGS